MTSLNDILMAKQQEMVFFQGFIINDQITSGVRVNNTRRTSNYYHFINPSHSKIDMTVAVNMQEYYLDIGVDPYSHNICIE